MSCKGEHVYMLSCTGLVITGVKPLTLLRVERLYFRLGGCTVRGLMFVEGESLMIRALIASASLNLSAVRTEAMSILHYKNHDRTSFLIY